MKRNTARAMVRLAVGWLLAPYNLLPAQKKNRKKTTGWCFPAKGLSSDQ